MTIRIFILSIFLAIVCFNQTNLIAQNASAEVSDVNFYYPKNAYRPIVSDGIATYLKDLKSFLDSHTDVNVKLDGYAQDGKNDEWNTRVSKYRVRALRDILIDHGIRRSRIEIEYFGKTGFMAEDDSESELAKNRRVELRVKS